MNVPLLGLIVFLPMIFAAAVWLMPDERWRRLLGRAAVTMNLGLTLVAVARFSVHEPGLQLVERAEWVSALGASYALGVDGVSLPFLVLTALLAGLVVWQKGALGPARTALPALLLLQGALTGVFVARDLLLFFVFWELTIVPVFILTSTAGLGPMRLDAALKYALYMFVASAFLMAAVLLVGVEAKTFDLAALAATPLDGDLQTALFFLLLAGFGVKAGLVPLHTWLPRLLADAPVGAAVMTVGLKIGAYGIMCVLLPLTPDATRRFGWIGCALGVGTALYGGLGAFYQANLRRFVGYASVSHAGLVVLGIFIQSNEGTGGALMMLVSAGLTSSALVFIAAFMRARGGSADRTAFSGMASVWPRLTVCFVLALVASIGLPGTSGFIGEQLILVAALAENAFLALAALGSSLVAGVYAYSLLEKTCFGPARDEHRAFADLDGRELATLAILCALTVLIGFSPRVLLSLV